MSEFYVGQPVRVSDGTKEPPKHHTKKHGAWELRNYDGFVNQVDDDRVVIGRQLKSRVCIAQSHKHVHPR